MTWRLITLDKELLGLIVIGGGALIRVNQSAGADLIAAGQTCNDVLLNRHGLLTHNVEILVVKVVRVGVLRLR